MKDRLDALRRGFTEALAAAGTSAAGVDAVRVRFLGKKGELTVLLKGLGTVAGGDRRAAGQGINALKSEFETALDAAKAGAGAQARAAALASDRIDASLPARRPLRGSLHPVTGTRRELEWIFRTMGFSVEVGPEVEDDFHNFEALNLPPGHPARDASDTFYLSDGLLLRTHTSPVQIRTMLKMPPPIRMICPGRVYRKDLDATHLPMFHQLEALVVGEGGSLAA